jgi:hypothetical protein
MGKWRYWSIIPDLGTRWRSALHAGRIILEKLHLVPTVKVARWALDARCRGGKKKFALLGIEPRVVQRIARHYTD